MHHIQAFHEQWRKRHNIHLWTGSYWNYFSYFKPYILIWHLGKYCTIVLLTFIGGELNF